MSNAINPTLVAPFTSQGPTEPYKVAFSWAEGKSATGAPANKVIIPNALTRKIMAETEAGVNIVNCANMDDLFNQLDS